MIEMQNAECKVQNDADIIKAFELCFAEKSAKETCEKCPYHKFGELCKVERGRDAFDLIIRLKTENESYKKTEEFISAKCDKMQANLAKFDQLFLEALVSVKFEAIKEFAERLKDEFEISSAYSSAYIECKIDNIVKELEENNE